MGFVVALTRINWCGNDGDTPAPTWSVRMAKDDKSRKTNKMDKGCIYPGHRSDFASFCMLLGTNLARHSLVRNCEERRAEKRKNKNSSKNVGAVGARTLVFFFFANRSKRARLCWLEDRPLPPRRRSSIKNISIIIYLHLDASQDTAKGKRMQLFTLITTWVVATTCLPLVQGYGANGSDSTILSRSRRYLDFTKGSRMSVSR